MGGSFVDSLVTRWQSFVGGLEATHEALAQVEADRNDVIAYLSTLRVVMGILGRVRSFDQACQETAEALIAETGAEACALAVRGRPGEEFHLRGFATQSQRFGKLESQSSVEEASWLASAALVAASGESTFYRSTEDGELIADVDSGAGPGLLGLPLEIGGEHNGVLLLEFVRAPVQRFAHRQALTLVANCIAGALTIVRTRDATERILSSLQQEVGSARHALSQHEVTLREKEEDLERMTAAVIESNHAKLEFLGTVSHELRTPLNAVLGYTELLRDGLVGPVTPEQVGMLQRVTVGARHLTQLIDDMLFFVQLDTNQASVTLETFALGELVSEVAGSLPERYSRSDAKLRVEIAVGAETVSSDRQLLKRVLFHLLTNGFKFTPAGEVALRASRGASDHGVVISVRDTGVGMSAERLDEIFECFRQLDMSNTRRFSGLGLGLALVKRCVRILGGELDVRSVAGEGSEFLVRLPPASVVQGSAGEPTPVHQ
jgi:signal transduction histidine kinase